MGVRVAYGGKSKISSAIASGTIPTDSIIITSDDEKQAELYFYDADEQLKTISERTKFASLAEAQAWARLYLNEGNIISVQNGTEWVAYMVGEGGTLGALQSAVVDVDFDCIDGGDAGGL